MMKIGELRMGEMGGVLKVGGFGGNECEWRSF
jgi:hypothetical protein